MLAKRNQLDEHNWALYQWHSFRAFVLSTGLYLYVEQKIALRDPEYAAHRTVLDWVYVVMTQEWFEAAPLGLSKAAPFLAQHYGLAQMKRELPDYRMFNFRASKEHLGEAATPWGQDPGEWHPDKQRPTLLDGFMFFPALASAGFYHDYLDLLESLLKAGADPNRMIEGLCLWIEGLCRWLGLRVRSSREIHTLQTLFEYGADPNKRCTASTFGDGILWTGV